MSFRGRGGGGFRGGDRGGRGGGFRGGRGGGNFGSQGPPEQVVEIAEVSHTCEGEIIAMCTNASVPLLARMIYTADKKLIGKVDDVFGPMSAPGVQVTPDKNSGVQSSSFKKGDKVSFETHITALRG
jgi:H/ACA ribonucleoprotein complex subunit 1